MALEWVLAPELVPVQGQGLEQGLELELAPGLVQELGQVLHKLSGNWPTLLYRLIRLSSLFFSFPTS